MITLEEIQKKYPKIKTYRNDTDEYIIIDEPITMKIESVKRIYKKEGANQYCLIEAPIILTTDEIGNTTLCSVDNFGKNIDINISDYIFPTEDQEFTVITFRPPENEKEKENVITKLKKELKKIENTVFLE